MKDYVSISQEAQVFYADSRDLIETAAGLEREIEALYAQELELKRKARMLHTQIEQKLAAKAVCLQAARTMLSEPATRSSNPFELTYYDQSGSRL